MFKKAAFLPRRLWGVSLLAVVVTLAIPSGVIWAGEPSLQVDLQADFTTTLDDEIVLIRDNKILIYDPYPLDGASVNWSVESSYNWRDVAAGDFNGDGDDEIAVINYDNSSSGGLYDRVLQIYDPVTGPAAPFTVTENDLVTQDRRWWRLATGDVDDDGKDEIALATYPNTTSDVRSYISVYDPWDGVYKCETYIDRGYVNGLVVTDMFPTDGRTEIVAAVAKDIDGNDGMRVYWRNGETCAGVGSNYGEGQGFDIASGNLDSDATREVVLAASPRNWEHDQNDYKSIAIWKNSGGNPLNSSGWWVYSYPGWGWGYYFSLSRYNYSPPYWGFITTADLNGTGDEEIVAIRNYTEWDSDTPNHLKVMDTYQPSGISNIDKTYDTAYFDGVDAGRFDGADRELVALLSPSLPGVYLYDLGVKPKGGLGVSDDGKTVLPVKTYRITTPSWAGERAKVMSVGDFDGPKLMASSNVVSLVYLTDGEVFIDQRQISLVYDRPGFTTNYSVTVSPPVDWLTVTPGMGALGASPKTLTFSSSLTGFGAPPYPEGAYSTSVIVSADTVGDLPDSVRQSPQVINVSLRFVDELMKLSCPLILKSATP